MSPSTIFFILGLLFYIIWFFTAKRKGRSKYFSLVAGTVLLFIPPFLPSYFFGSWNAIKDAKNREIKKIILMPSQPEYECNLVSSTVKLENKVTIDHLLNLLQKAQAYFPNHKSEIWEVKLLLLDSRNDTLPIRIEKLVGGETVIYSNHGNYKKEGLSEFLEEIVSFTAPVKGKL